MKVISRAAMAAAIIGASGLALSAPAVAKDKKEAAAADGLKLTPAVRGPAATAQTALQAKDYATADTALQPAEAAAVTDDDKYIVNALRFEIDLGKINAAGGGPAQQIPLAKYLDALLANPKTPPNALGQYNYYRGLISFNAREYAQAKTFFQRSKELGFQNPDLQLQLVKSKIETGDIAGGLADLDTAIKAEQAAGRKPPEDWYRYALSRLQKTTQYDDINAWNRRWLSDYGTPQNWRAAIYVFGFDGPGATRVNKRQRIDLFRLLRDTKSIAGAAEFSEYAQSAIDVGLPTEAKSAVEAGKAAGAFGAGNKAAADLLAQANRSSAAEGSLSSLETKARAAADGKAAAQTGDANLGAGNNAKAADLYKLALTKGGVDADEVNTHLGIALARLGDKAGATAALQQVETPPRSQIAALWLTWLGIDAKSAPAAAAAPAAS